jgi:hypothetical protein
MPKTETELRDQLAASTKEFLARWMPDDPRAARIFAAELAALTGSVFDLCYATAKRAVYGNEADNGR